MNFDTPFVEYLIIGFHTATWIVILVLAMLGQTLMQLLVPIDDPIALILLFLPFAYLLGITVDSVMYPLLDRKRSSIKNEIFGISPKQRQKDGAPDVPSIPPASSANIACKDEFIALVSPELYDAYESRVRRVRILGTAIPNWLFLAGALVYYYTVHYPISYDVDYWIFPALVGTTGATLSILSFTSWKGLYRRAYKFRKNACEIIALKTGDDQSEVLNMPDRKA